MGKACVTTAEMKPVDLIGWKPKFYDPTVASVRIRCLNPISELRARGLSIELFDRRRVSTYRVVVFSKLYDDATFRQATELKASGTIIIFDLCDNHFYNPHSWRPLTKAREQLLRMMTLADYVVTSTETLAEVVRSVKPDLQSINVIGDAVETDMTRDCTPWWLRWWHARHLARLHAITDVERSEGRTSLVWFGLHGGPNAAYGMMDLLSIRSCLEHLNREFPLSLTVISNSWKKYLHVMRGWDIPTRYLPWSANTFVSALQAHTIAVIPISSNPFTRCKTNNRVVTALQAGLATVADSIPSYEEFRRVTRLDCWESGLREYISKPELRAHDVRLAQSMINERWTIPKIADQWQLLFQKVISTYPGRA
jgi:hypothetical protein